MFHLKDGFFFERTPEGGIHIAFIRAKRTIKDTDDSVTVHTEVTENEWASVIASTSSRGENLETFNEALDYLHKES